MDFTDFITHFTFDVIVRGESFTEMLNDYVSSVFIEELCPEITGVDIEEGLSDVVVCSVK